MYKLQKHRVAEWAIGYREIVGSPKNIIRRIGKKVWQGEGVFERHINDNCNRQCDEDQFFLRTQVAEKSVFMWGGHY